MKKKKRVKEKRNIKEIFGWQINKYANGWVRVE
jgi:hypothetical protein